MIKTKKDLIWAIVIVIFTIISIVSVSYTTKSPSDHSDRERRCWYCGKVIVNSDGDAIHISNGKCDYCGK